MINLYDHFINLNWETVILKSIITIILVIILQYLVFKIIDYVEKI